MLTSYYLAEKNEPSAFQPRRVEGGEAAHLLLSRAPFLRACIPTTICVSGIFRGF